MTTQPTLVLAPMQAVTNLPFMNVLKQMGGPDYYVTEYFRVHELYHVEKKILRSITENTTGKPIYAQLIGQDIDALIRVSKELEKHPIEGIDLNLGCPAPVVYRKDAGGGLLRKKEHMENIIAAMRDAISGKFTVKTRIGFEHEDEFSELLEIFNRYEIDTLTIHGRTVKERYQTPVHTDCIQRAVQQMNCPVIANGNIVDVSTALGMTERTGAAGLMVGRGAIRNPWIFDQIRAAYSGEISKVILRQDLYHYIMLLYDETAFYAPKFDETKHVQRMKKYLTYISQGVDEAFEFQIRRAKTAPEFKAICDDLLNNSEPVPIAPPEDSKIFCGFAALR